MGLEKTKIQRLLGYFLLILILGFAAVILLQLSVIFLGPSKRACSKKVCLAKYLEGPPAFNDDSLKRYIQNKHFEVSKGPPNYTTEVGFDSNMEELKNIIQTRFQGKRNGKFVVLGAGDGEFEDITLPLEKEFGWSGLLVEPHPELFKLLKSKGRKATLSNNCVSPFAYPSNVLFGHESISAGDSDRDKFNKYRGTKVKQLIEDDTNIETFRAQCIPLENLIYSADIDKIDLLVLDMSGTDLDVLVNVRLDMIPDIEMAIIHSNGVEQGADLGNYFLDKNIVLKKAFTDNVQNAIYILMRFENLPY